MPRLRRDDRTVRLPRWRGEPLVARAGLAAVLVVAAVLLVWNLGRGGDFGFYEASARSMSESLRALVFGAFDPAGTVTLDKLSGFAVPQALSVRLLGMSTSALALPEVVEGLVTVWACSLGGLRWGGSGTGLVAAAAAATTPICVSMFAHPMEDGLLTMALAVAFVCWQRAVLTGTWPGLVWAGVFVGVGFQAKMVQAWFVVPALVLGTVVAGGASLGRRLARAGAFLMAAAVASLSWITVIALTPAAERPYVDGSTDNSVFAMVFGYNGVNRLLPGLVPGAVGASTSHAGLVAAVEALARSSGSSRGTAAASHLKLLLPVYATQVGWLYPVALAGVVLGIARWWPRRRVSPHAAAQTGVLAALLGWLAVAVVVLSLAKLPHTAYVAAVAVQLALLAAAGWSEAVRLLRSRRASARWVVPLVVGGQVAWSARLAVGGQLPTVLLAPALVVGVGGLVWSVWAAARGRVSWRPATAAVTAAAVLAGQGMFSLQVLDAARDGSGGDASVGVVRASGTSREVFRVSSPVLWGGTPRLTSGEAKLVAAARAAGGGADGGPLFLSDSWSVSADVINATGDSVLTDGGYSRKVTVYGLGALYALVASGRVRLFVVASPAPAGDLVRQLVAGASCRSLGTWRTGSDSVTLWRCS